MNHDDSLMAEIAGQDDPVQPADSGKGGSPRHGRRRAERPRSSTWRTLLPLLLVLAVIAAMGGGAYMGYRWISERSTAVEADTADYTGPGTGSVKVTIDKGDSGKVIADKLVAAGVIKASGPFTRLFANTPKAASISPGTYELRKQMSSSDALRTLMDPSSFAGKRVTIAEGLRLKDVFAKLSEETGIPVADFEAAAKDYRSLGIPENPAHSAEGYLWPGRYDIPEKATAKQILTMMAARMQEELKQRGVAPQDQNRILTLASIAEKEARSTEDYGKVVRTIDNRLAGVGEAGGRPMKLQLDSTVAYANGHSRISTTPKERATPSPYNTYLNAGLPIGPISNPGGATIDAALNPPPGPWLYWVTVNTDTGQTVFSSTKKEHDAAVRQWQEWARTKKG